MKLFLDMYYCFDSKLVRLKGRSLVWMPASVKLCFNSKLVRLKVENLSGTKLVNFRRSTADCPNRFCVYTLLRVGALRDSYCLARNP